MTSSEQTILDTIIPRLRDEGYEVFAHPSAQILPAFMRRDTPDAIAIRPDRRLAIEVVRDDPSSHAKLVRLREVLDGQRDWELRVYWINSFPAEPQIETSDVGSIETSIREVESLLHQGFAASALLQAWANFEAAARMLAPTQFSQPQTTERLIEALASNGMVTPLEADRLRDISRVRNHVAHGDLRTQARPEQIRTLNAITETMISEAVPLP